MRQHHAFAQKPNQLFNRTPTGFAGSRPLTQALGHSLYATAMFANKPNVYQVELSREYSFMYENLVIATQSATYLLLEKSGTSIYALRFDSPNCKYGGPNDEAHAGHPLTKFGLGAYGLYEVENSPWIEEMKNANRVHPSHSDALFNGRKHYVACFKDVKLESVCRSMSEVTLSQQEVLALVAAQLDELET